MRFNLDKAMGIHEQAMYVRAKRTSILASNIANADTPNYKARDMDFKRILQQSMHGQSADMMRTTHAKHIQVGPTGELANELLYRSPLQPSIDGNTVDSQIEKAEFSENAIQYQASVHFLGGKIKSLLAAIKGE